MDKKDYNIKCPADEELSAFWDGDLGELQQSEIGVHLNSCEICRQAVQEIKEISSGLNALGLEKSPEHIWSNIENAQRAKAVDPWAAGFRQWWEKWWKMPAIAIAVGAAAAVFLIVTLPPARVQKINPQSTTALDRARTLDTVMKAEQTYAQAINLLEKSFDQEKTKYSPEVQKTIAQSMNDINRAIDQYRKAIGQAPDNMEAHRATLAAYQQKVDILTDLVVDSL